MWHYVSLLRITTVNLSTGLDEACCADRWFYPNFMLPDWPLAWSPVTSPHPNLRENKTYTYFTGLSGAQTRGTEEDHIERHRNITVTRDLSHQTLILGGIAPSHLALGVV